MTGEPNMIDFLPAYFLLATVLIAAVTDILTHRIPNNLLAPALVLALLTGIATGGATGLVLSLAGLVVGFAGAFLGPEGALVAGLMTFVAGAIFGLVWIAWRILQPAAAFWLARIMQASHAGLPQIMMLHPTTKTSSFAYAPAIATGVGFAIWQQGWLIPTVMV